MAILRYAAGQRHVRMNAEPAAVRLPRQNYCGPARAVEGGSIFMETRARPGRDRDCHRAVRRGHDHGVCQVEAELRRARPDIVPLPFRPGR